MKSQLTGLKYVLLASVFLLATACSNRQTYEALQSMEQSRCVNGPANDYQNCLQRSELSYAEWQQLRNENGDEDT